ncbi:MAG TPA: stalk domain-containing protein [Bacilli bacterium]|nr:stalk domain-containing protein [Bacilli bacterium]
MWKTLKRSLSVLLMTALCVTTSTSPVAAATTRISGVPIYGQYPELPSGCEATAVSMVMRWAGSDATKVDVANAMPREPLPYWQDGKMVGGDPFQGFVGDPYAEHGAFGIFAKPMVAVVNKFLPGRGKDLTGSDFSDLLAVVDSGRPVAAWVTNYLQEPVNNANWTTAQGRSISWHTPEHVMTIVGYNDTQMIINDAATGTVRTYSRQRFQYVWEKMGRQALTVTAAQAHYQVYQYNTLLREFPTLQESIAYAKRWDHASVVEMANGQWKWDNWPSLVYQRDHFLQAFSSRVEAIAYARQWDHAKVVDQKSYGIVWSNWPLTVFLNGVEQQYDQPPINDHGRVLVPLRGIAEKIGGDVGWDGATQTVSIAQGGHVITLQIGSPLAFVDGKQVQLDVPAKIINSRTMVPVRFISESFGAIVKWDGMLQSVYITVGKS